MKEIRNHTTALDQERAGRRSEPRRGSRQASEGRSASVVLAGPSHGRAETHSEQIDDTLCVEHVAVLGEK